MSTLIQTLALAVLTALASNGAGAGQTTSSTQTKTTALPIFQPENLGAPKVRVGGGSRGPNEYEPVLYVLAPEQAGLTTRTQPVLYWYISKPVNKTIEITVTDKQSVLLKTTIDGLGKAGIQTLKLAEHGVHLQPDTKYKWSVAIVNNPKQRSSDTFASGGIMLFPETGELKAKLAAANEEDRVLIYAEEGIWYDDLEAIQRLAGKSPGDEMPVKMRTALLGQVGLSVLDEDGK
ncbi:MAG: DUF928 domain-containing protein [Methylobacter sp.]